MTFVALTMHKKYDICGFDNVACRFIYHKMTNDASLAKPVLWIVLQKVKRKNLLGFWTILVYLATGSTVLYSRLPV